MQDALNPAYNPRSLLKIKADLYAFKIDLWNKLKQIRVQLVNLIIHEDKDVIIIVFIVSQWFLTVALKILKCFADLFGYCHHPALLQLHHALD